MKFNIKQIYFGDPPFCFRGPVPGRDLLFGKRWVIAYSSPIDIFLFL